MVECVSALVGTGKLMIGCRRSCRPSHGCGGGVASEVGGGSTVGGESNREIDWRGTRRVCLVEVQNMVIIINHPSMRRCVEIGVH